jgi:uncharacterized membrane protein
MSKSPATAKINNMSIKDSIYTNPDALRARYLQPKNVMQNIDEATAQTETAILQQTTITTGIVGGGDFGSVGGSLNSGGFGGGGGGGNFPKDPGNDSPDLGGLLS